MTDEKKQPRQHNGPVYRCGECGAVYNTFDYACPVCALKAEIDAKVELGVAASTMQGDEEKPAKKKAK